MNRRTFLTTAPAIAAAPVATFANVPQTPAMTAFREWKAHHDYIDGLKGRHVPDEEFDQLTDRNRDLQVQLFRVTSTGPLDTLAKLTAYTFNGEEFSDDGGRWSATLLAEAASMVSAATL